MSKVAAIFLLSCFISVSCSQDNQPLDDLILEYMSENHIPGLAWALVKDGEISWSESYGMADVERQVPMSIHGILNVASVTKTITATAIMQLWEQGQIDLDEDINRYLPRAIRNPHFPEAPITVFQLLTHTSSLIDGAAYYKSYSCGDPQLSLKDWMLSYFYEDGTNYNKEENFLQDGPGEKAEYSNVGYGLLGYILEEVSGMSFSEYCSKNIFQALGMKESGYYLKDMDISNHIIPYFDEEFIMGEFLAPCLYSFPNIPDGLLRTSVEELSYFLVAYMNGGVLNSARILQESTVELMLTIQLEGNTQGLCWHKSDFEALWGHGGNDPGVTTSMFFSPATKTGIIIFQNSGQGNQFEILENIYRIARKN
jgi:CubicO group peptidase (beta-lactamase class C family)